MKSGDGFYADGSFIQHGAVPYAGNYGAVALDNMARLIALLGAGPWPIRDPNLGIERDAAHRLRAALGDVDSQRNRRYRGERYGRLTSPLIFETVTQYPIQSYCI